MKKKKKTIILASGTFDLLHFGHLYYLRKAKQLGGDEGKLIVIVARDKTVENRKGKKPIINEEHRRAVVESLRVVDEALLGYEEFDILRVIEKIKPDIIAVGYDQKQLENKLRKLIQKKEMKIKIFKIDFFEFTDLDSSTKIKKKIINDFKKISK